MREITITKDSNFLYFNLYNFSFWSRLKKIFPRGLKTDLKNGRFIIKYSLTNDMRLSNLINEINSESNSFLIVDKR